MSNSPVPGPRSPWRDWDELIAIFVAFGVIGTIIFWGLTRQQNGSWLSTSEPPVPGIATDGGFPFLNGSLSEQRRTQRQNNAPALPGPPAATVRPGGVPLPPTPAPADVPAPPPFVLPFGIGAPNPPAPAAIAPPTVAPVTIPSPAIAPSPTAPAVVIVRPTTSPATFSDVPQGYWAAPFIVALSQRGAAVATVGGSFQPDRPATRVEYATELEKIFQPATPQSPVAFQDVPTNYPAIAAINTAVQSGFMRGYSEGVFRPDQPMPRYQVLLSLVNGLGLPAPADPTAVVNTFSDANQLPAWAVPSVAAAAQAGLVVNPNDVRSLEPNRPVTRAEMAAMIYQALVASGQAQPIQSDAIARP